jgi:hypothetical protein
MEAVADTVLSIRGAAAHCEHHDVLAVPGLGSRQSRLKGERLLPAIREGALMAILLQQQGLVPNRNDNRGHAAAPLRVPCRPETEPGPAAPIRHAAKTLGSNLFCDHP